MITLWLLEFNPTPDEFEASQWTTAGVFETEDLAKRAVPEERHPEWSHSIKVGQKHYSIAYVQAIDDFGQCWRVYSLTLNEFVAPEFMHTRDDERIR